LEQILSKTKYLSSYEKLIDSNTPHPSEKIDYAQQILSANAITIFNHPLKSLNEDEKFLNKRYIA